ncbi:polymorphic toxin-type HINT domain-containing protein [Actinoplanes sp. NPDC023801]|uniref:polymorphic toxin-type HINT domain-containing protein n=1 Tax=Actinoplanes sp. NPDC023801 TaxID=3154595 RepID=UPI0033D77484
MSRPRIALAAGLSAVLVLGLGHAPAMAVKPDPYKVESVKPVKKVPVKAAKIEPAPKLADPAPASAKAAPVWPKAGGEVLPASGEAGSLPVRVEQAAQAQAARSTKPAPSRVRVEVLDRKATEKAGVRGVLLRMGRADGVAEPGKTKVTLDYKSFATAYGADWSSRLRLVSLPACALTTPDKAGCAGTPLDTSNDTKAQTLSADVAVSSASSLVAASAAPSGPAGDYSATTLNASSTWSAGGNSGDFTWSYPMRMPPSLGGPTPQVGLSYSSQSVDGRHAASNNQPSRIGEGFEEGSGGFIERRYQGCAQDMGDSANNKEKTGDLCWETDNATLSLAGHSGELIYNSADGRWHLRSEDGSRIERRTGAANGDNNGEYWVLTATSGVQYWFGLNRVPGWSTGKPVTNSVSTAPVFGNDAGEPCHGTAFIDSDCVQAWRWNLDYVVDPLGNSMSYWYGKATNKYGRNLDKDDAASYDRESWLERIDYGTRTVNGADNVHDTIAPMRVDFGYADRCLSECATHNATRWPDVPWDSECTGDTCEDNFSPTFWSTKRLASVTTQLRNGSSYRNVDRWTLTHTFPDPGDGTRAGLWLSKLSYTGLVGGSASVPDVEFTPVQRANRVDVIGDFAGRMNWMRIARIRTESGGTISVEYSDQDCKAGATPTPETNTSRCYPVRWVPEGYKEPVTDWFNKYVVTTIYEQDNTGGAPPVGSPRKVFKYTYFDGAAWHYSDDDGLTKKKFKTWSNYRGYGRVGVTAGDSGDPQTYSETRYFRGMNGDRLNAAGGVKPVSVDGIADEDWFAGQTRETITYNGPGGAVVSRVRNTPWASAPTATRTINGDTVAARYTGTASTTSHVALDGGRGERVTKTVNTFDEFGMIVQVEDLGQDGVPGDERCTKTDYTPRNADAWIMDRAHRTQNYAVACSATTGTLTEQQVIGETRTLYDGAAFETAPVKGLGTQTQMISAWNSGSPTFVAAAKTTYDAHGRPTAVTDARNYTTTTAYTPALDGPLTESVTKNALLHETKAMLEPAWGVALAVVDANGKRTDTERDALGRLTSVWNPGRAKGTDAPHLKYAYTLNTGTPSVVTTSVLNASGAYVTTYALYDGLLRPRQTQAPSPSGGRVVTEMFYDTVGREILNYGAYHTSGNPGGTLLTTSDQNAVPTQSRNVYDGAGRTVASIFQPYGVERWRTTTAYGGDRVDVTPPSGGTATSTVSDARGRTIELRQYNGTTPTPYIAGSWVGTEYKFDARGYQTQVVDHAKNDWVYTYDIRGMQIQVDDPDRGITKFTYDNAGNMLTSTDARNKKVAYLYDALGRKSDAYDTRVGGTQRAQWIYDTVAKGQLSQSTRFVGSASYQSKALEFNDSYQPTKTQIIIPDTETGVGGIYNYATTYNIDGSVKSTTIPATNTGLQAETLTYAYNDFGMPTTVDSLYGTTNQRYVTGTDYNALGLLDQVKLYTGTGEGGRVYTKYTREIETGRVKNIRTDRDSVAPYILSDTGYEYDDAGNITKIADTAPEGADDIQCFDYDQLLRLTHAWTPVSGDCAAAPSATALGGPAPYWYSWTFDTLGNRKTETIRNASITATTTYEYPASGPTSVRPHAVIGTTGARTGSYTYDATGNTLTRPTSNSGTQTFTWDAEGHVDTATDNTGTTTYIYDADGNRLIQRDSAGRTLYLPGQEIRYTNSTATTSCTRYYSHAGGTIGSRSNTGLTWLSSDHQGTAGIAINATTQQATTRRQTPYGTPRGVTIEWPNTRGYVGGTKDNTGLTHLGAREYDPVNGRFISVDPVQDLADPQQWNGYSYANNSPITLSDPTGLRPACGTGFDVPCGNYDPHPHFHQPTEQKYDTSGEIIEGKKTVDDTAQEKFGVPYNKVNDLYHEQIQQETWCYNNQVACENGEKAKIQQGNEFLKDATSVGDAEDCFAGEGWGACAWLVVGFVGVGKIAKIYDSAKHLDEAAELGESCYRKSFSEDTKVLLADGSSKAIKDLRKGDRVLAADPETGESGPREIEAVWVHDDDLYVIVIDGQRLVTTEDHPFWNATDKQWQFAEKLDTGDLVQTPVGTARVDGFDRSVHRVAPAYNLTVADLHTYYVLAGTTPVLVHNDECPRVPFGPKMNYKNNKKHDHGVLGTSIGPHPTRGQEMLDESFLINGPSGRRAAYDKVNKEIIIFAPDNHNATYHGFQVTWEMLDQKVKSAFVGQGIFNDKGKLKAGWK